MAEVRKLVTRWGFQVDLKPLEQMKKSVAEMKAGIRGIATEATAAATTLFVMAETTAKYGKEASLSAQRSGMSVEAFQEMAFAAKKAGVDSEGLTHAMAHMNRSMFEAKTGNHEAMKSFMQLGGGVAQSVLQGKPAQEVFMKIADRIAGMKDESAKAALSMHVFGRAGFQMLPLLNKGSKGFKEMADEAHELGLIMTDADIALSKKFMGSLHGVEGMVIGLKRSIGIGLLAPMIEVFDSFSNWMKINRAVIKQNISSFFLGLGRVLKITLTLFNALAGRLTNLIQPLGGVGNALAFVATGFAVFKSLQIMHGIGLAGLAFAKLASSITLVGDASLLTQAKALAFPILMTIGMIALMGMFEDLIGFSQGMDSVTGELVDMVKAWDPIFAKFGIWGRMITFLFTLPINAAVTALRTMGGVLGSLVSGGGLSGAMDAIKEGVHDFAMTGSNAVTGNGFNFTNQLGFGDTAPKAQNFAPQGSQVPQQNININNTVNVPSGTDPHLVGDRVQDGVSKSLDNALRPAHRAVSSGVEY